MERELQDLDFLENDLIAREAGATTFKEWWDLRQRRNQLRAERALLREALGKARMEKKKDSLSDDDITEARGLIAFYNKRRYTATQTIRALMRKFNMDQPGAARVYWTETKRDDTNAVLDLGKEIGFETYKVILSPSACHICREKTRNGDKVFKASELNKSGYGHKPPFHPNCYCILVPHVE